MIQDGRSRNACFIHIPNWKHITNKFKIRSVIPWKRLLIQIILHFIRFFAPGARFSSNLKKKT